MTCLDALAAVYILTVLFVLLFVQGARHLEELSERRTYQMERAREIVRALVAVIKKRLHKTADTGLEARDLADTIARNVAETGKDCVVFRDPPTRTDQ